jgi:hypothetical protein
MRKPGVSLLDMADQVGEQVQALARTAGHDPPLPGIAALFERNNGGLGACEVQNVCMAEPHIFQPAYIVGSGCLIPVGSLDQHMQAGEQGVELFCRASSINVSQTIREPPAGNAAYAFSKSMRLVGSPQL